jgi:predicted RNA-binding Zn-ribbon protein involved in translation (DUF1610 family)
MKIVRSSKLSLKFSNQKKRDTLSLILSEYHKVVSSFIDTFWSSPVLKYQLTKTVLNQASTWLSQRLKQNAASEALSLISSSIESAKELGRKPVKPKHNQNTMRLNANCASLAFVTSGEFDMWLNLGSIGNSFRLAFPLKGHKHFADLLSRGRVQNSFLITDKCVQVSFKIETGPKKAKDKCIGVDSGINTLAVTSTGKLLGTDIKKIVEKIKRKRHGSKSQKRAVRHLISRFGEVAKQVCDEGTLVVVEQLKGITKDRKKNPVRRSGKDHRRSLGRWNVRKWLERLEMTCQDRNVSFRTVRSFYTSQTCPSCGFIERRNRKGEVFRCLKCGYSDHADVVASRNILSRFLTGKYGSGCQAAS